jgi:hypothetical protein
VKDLYAIPRYAIHYHYPWLLSDYFIYLFVLSFTRRSHAVTKSDFRESPILKMFTAFVITNIVLVIAMPVDRSSFLLIIHCDAGYK